MDNANKTAEEEDMLAVLLEKKTVEMGNGEL